ncbi:MAG: hypothetical protein HKN21_13665 [Candidatus Eisenbacteria bacterium]|uniref:BON domain-containing protein n=1 Tax=Eiseniibacteriota bacterium TaxID=2212470 RepID=A0A7Y2H382_UNCEI|nr:hypothetical protein [Candidatus Eisenbacteria bacterium]
MIQRWVDLAGVDYTVGNGVVYLRGSLRRRCPIGNGHAKPESMVELAARLESDIRKIVGVRGVVFQLENLVKDDLQWRAR